MSSKKVEKKALETLKKMSFDEKLEIITGTDILFTKGVPRLGVRRLNMADASMGLRYNTCPATAFPASIALAATWDVETAKAYGAAVGSEFRAAGMDVILGPGVNLYRVPHCGRNFEYLGEDPRLASSLVVSYIKGAQEQGVSATVKHFACNNTDWHRNVSDSVVDERTLREVYLAAFEAAVKDAGVMALMTSYNLVNGEYAAESRHLLREILREDWGFEGLVMSDWEGSWNLKESFESGLDLEMPKPKVWDPAKMKDLAKKKKLDLKELDRKVLSILRWTFAIEELQATAPKGRRKCAEHAKIALDVARKGCVLLKNERNILPLRDKNIKVCVMGACAIATPASGGGAAGVWAMNPQSILGAVSDVAPDITLSTAINTSMRNDNIPGAVEEARKADVVVLCVGFGSAYDHEGSDRQLDLPWEQTRLISECLAANPNTIIVVNAGGGLQMDFWADKAPAIIHAWYPGENGAIAIAEILFGKTNPSGRLPISLEREWKDAPAYGNYLPDGASPYQNPDYNSLARPVFQVKYEEGVFVGYRHYDKTGKAPLFPFGHGLSYTTFKHSALKIEKTGEREAKVTFKVSNVGKRAGIETPQLYVGDLACSVPRPKRELKSFARVELEPGETKTVELKLSERDFAFYDVKGKNWKVEPGEFSIEIGASARDIRLKGSLKLS